MQAEVLAEAAQDDDVGPQDGLFHDARVVLGVGELQERLVDDDQVQVLELIHEVDDRTAAEEAAVGVVRVADDGDTGAAGADELDVLGRVQSEAVGLHEREHVDPLAGLHGLVGPAAEGGDGDGEDSRTSRWSIQVISSVEPLPIATQLGGSWSSAHSSAVIVSALLG